MNYTRKQREIPLTNLESKINESVSKGFRFEMEVLGSFKASSIYQQDPDIRMINGDKGYCDGILYYAPKKENHKLSLNRKIAEIEVKLRNGVGREDRDVLIDVIKESSVNSFLKYNLTLDPNNYNRIVVLGMIKDLGSHHSTGLSSYDMYGSIAVVFFQKKRLAANEYQLDQVIRFYESFHEFNQDVYSSISFDDYFDKLNGSSSTKKYFEMMSLGNFKELSFVILDNLKDFSATEEQIFRKILSHQIKIGVDKSFTAMNRIVDNHNGTAYMKKLFGIGWIMREDNSYRVNFIQIINDLFKTSSPFDCKSTLKEAGLDV